MKKLKVWTNSQRTIVMLQTDEGFYQFSTSLEPSVMDLAFEVAMMYCSGTSNFKNIGEPVAGCDKLVLSIAYDDQAEYKR